MDTASNSYQPCHVRAYPAATIKAAISKNEKCPKDAYGTCAHLHAVIEKAHTHIQSGRRNSREFTITYDAALKSASEHLPQQKYYIILRTAKIYIYKTGSLIAWPRPLRCYHKFICRRKSLILGTVACSQEPHLLLYSHIRVCRLSFFPHWIVCRFNPIRIFFYVKYLFMLSYKLL